jgi:hypothetical protein
MQQRLSGGSFEFSPQRIAAPEQRDVRRMLEIAQPDDARSAMRGAAIMSGFEPVEAENACTAARKMVDRGAAHRAKPNHHDIIGLHVRGIIE